jgi:hypothetical protein
MAIVTVGIDLAKNVFAVDGVDEGDKPTLVRPSVPRANLLEFIGTLPHCLAVVDPRIREDDGFMGDDHVIADDDVGGDHVGGNDGVASSLNRPHNRTAIPRSRIRALACCTVYSP